MAIFSFDKVKISGISACVPKDIKETLSLKCFDSKEDAEKFIKVSHVERTRIAPDGVCASDLCYHAAEKLISELNWDKNDIEALFYVSFSRDYKGSPNTSCLLQNRLGLSTECMCFDLPAACYGLVYNLPLPFSLISSGKIKKALLLAGEKNTESHSDLDKTMWPLMGDGGSAVAIEFDENADNSYFNLGTDGSGEKLLYMPDGGSRNPFSKESLEMQKCEDGMIRNNLHHRMDGMNIFSFSINEPVKSIKKLCETYSIEIENIDYLLLHQANEYIDEKIAKKIKVPVEKVPFSLEQFGNTSSASIPLSIVTLIRSKILKKKISVIFCAFGGGLSWGTCYLSLDNVVCPELIEV